MREYGHTVYPATVHARCQTGSGEDRTSCSTKNTATNSNKQNKTSFEYLKNSISWKNNFDQLKIEASTTYLPKLTILLVLRALGPNILSYLSQKFPTAQWLPPSDEINTSHKKFNWLSLVDELYLDVINVATAYFLAPLAYPLVARAVSKLFNISDWRLAGIPVKELEHNFKNSIEQEVGIIKNSNTGEILKSFKPAKYKLTPKLMNSLNRVKFLSSIMAAFAGMFAVTVEPFIRNILTTLSFKESNYYSIQGMETNRTDKQKQEQNDFTIKRSLKYLAGITLAYIGAVGATVFASLAKRKNSGANSRGLLKNNTVKKLLHFTDGGKNFQLSPFAFAALMTQAVWAYPAGGRPIYNDPSDYTNNPEKSELGNRIWFVALAAILIKPLAKAIFINPVVARKYNKLLNKKDKLNLVTPWKEVLKRNAFLDFSPVHAERIKSLPGYKKLSLVKQEELLNSVETFEKKHVFYPIVISGFLLNVLNYIITFKKNNIEQHHNYAQLGQIAFVNNSLTATTNQD